MSQRHQLGSGQVPQRHRCGSGQSLMWASEHLKNILVLEQLHQGQHQRNILDHNYLVIIFISFIERTRAEKIRGRRNRYATLCSTQEKEN